MTPSRENDRSGKGKNVDVKVERMSQQPEGQLGRMSTGRIQQEGSPFSRISGAEFIWTTELFPQLIPCGIGKSRYASSSAFRVCG